MCQCASKVSLRGREEHRWLRLTGLAVVPRRQHGRLRRSKGCDTRFPQQATRIWCV